MPDLSSNRTALRADGHKARTYLAVFNGSVVASGTLDAAPANGDVALDWTRTAGSSADIKPGYRVVVESAGGALKFETSVRYSGTISDSSLPIREVATAEFTLSASDVVKIFNTPVLTDKLVEDEATFAPDGITYSAQNTTIAPIANSGGHWCGFVDAGQTYATVVTYGAASYTVDPDSAGTLTHLWTLPTGVAFAGGSANTDANPTLQANVGYHVITHTVTDSSNSATWTQYLLIRVYSAASPPVECVVESIDGDEAQGWSGRVRVFDSASLSSIPDRSLVAVFVDETINGSTASYGNRIASRSHMKLLGYLVRDDNEGDATDDTLTFEILSPWARLQEIPGFSKVLERYASTTGWRYIQGLTVKRAILQILRWYTNWTEFFDTVFNTFTDYDYPAFYVEKATPLAQLQELADGTDARVTGDRTGALLIGTRPELVALASRSSLTTTITLQDDDRVRYSFSRGHFRTVDTLECRGFVSATATASAVAIFSRYPGIPGRGAQVTAIDRLIAASQSNLNDRCGLRGAAADGVFITSAGLMHRAVQLELELPGSYDVFDPAYQEWVAFTGAAGNRRELDLSAFRFIVRSVNITYAGGTAKTIVRLTSETAAPAGQTYVPTPTNGPNPDIGIEFPTPDFPDAGDVWLGAGTSRIALICQNGLARTTNFGSGLNTNWDYVAWSGITGSTSRAAYTAVPDAFSYGTSAVKVWVLHTGSAATVYYLDVTNRTSTLKYTFPNGWNLLWTLNENGNAGGMDASFGTQNHVVATVYDYTFGVEGARGTYAAYTTDNSTWTGVQVSTGYSGEWNTGGYKIPSVFVSSRTPGKVITSAFTGANSNAQSFYSSSNYGATWATTTTPTLGGTRNLGISLHCPWDPARNSGETLFFYGTSSARTYRWDGSSNTDISPGGANGPVVTRNGLSTFPANANRLLACTSGSSGKVIYLTDNALAASPSWTQLSPPVSYYCGAIAGDTPNAFYFWGGRPGGATVGASIDGGASIVSQVGNLGSYSTGSVLMLVGW